MKIALLGAIGATGSIVREKALASGHSVKALVRNPSAIAPRSGLTIVKGDVDNQTAVNNVVEGTQVVIVALGVRKNEPGITVVQKGVAAALEAMRLHSVKRIVVVTSSGVTDRFTKPGIIAPALLPGVHRHKYVLHDFMLNHIYADLEAAERVLESSAAAGIDWTIVQPPLLLPTASVGYETTLDGPIPGATGMLPFTDLAQCLLDVATQSGGGGSFSRRKVHVNTRVACKADRGNWALFEQQPRQVSAAIRTFLGEG